MPAGLSAATLTAGPAWSAEPNGNVTVRWTTDVATGSRVQYGTAANKLDQRVDGELGLKHAVTLKGLLPGTTYFYTVGTARQALATNSFTLAGDAPAKPETATVKPGKPDAPAAQRPRPRARHGAACPACRITSTGTARISRRRTPMITRGWRGNFCNAASAARCW